MSKIKQIVIHLRLEFVAFAPTCLGRRDLLSYWIAQIVQPLVTEMRQVGQTTFTISQPPNRTTTSRRECQVEQTNCGNLHYFCNFLP
jgi:hypothetical protein